MIPAVNVRHVEEGLALLISQYRKKPIIEAFLASWLRPIQDAEDALWELVESRMLSVAVAAQLDSLGKLVGELRLGRSDALFRAAIRLRIRVNRSKGRTTDVIDVALLAVEGDANAIVYREYPYLHFGLEIFPLAGERYIAELLAKTRAAGSYGHLITAALPLAEFLRFGDASDPVAGIITFGDAVSGQGRLAAAGYGLPADYRGALVSGSVSPLLPRVDWVEPLSGEPGDPVTIHGLHFTGATSVTFDGTPATSVVVVNDARITCVVPSDPVGTIDVAVTTPAGTGTKVDAFTYAGGLPAPTITSLSIPLTDVAGGGLPITATGTGFQPGCILNIDGTNATTTTYVSATSLTFVPAAHVAAANLTVTVTNPDTQTGSLSNAFEYFNPATGAGGIWRAGNYTEAAGNGTWTGSPSSLTNATTAPQDTPGSLPHLDGINDYLASATALNAMLTSAHEGTIVVIGKPTAHPAADPNPYLNPLAFHNAGNATIGLAPVTSGGLAGWMAHVYESVDYQQAFIAAPAGSLYTVIMRYLGGTSVDVTVNNVAFGSDTMPGGDWQFTSGALEVGRSFGASAFYQGEIHAMIFYPDRKNGTFMQKLIRWGQQQFGAA